MKKILIILLFSVPVALMAQTKTSIGELLRYRKYTSAETEARLLSKAAPHNTENWYWLSQVLVQKKDSAGLVALAGEMPATAADDPWIKITKGNMALAGGKIAEANAYFEVAVSETRSKNKDVLAAIARANIYSASGNKAYALEMLKKAIKRDRKDPELYTLQGDAYFRLKQGSEAFQAFEAAIKLNNSYAPALYELGKIFATQANEEFYLKYFNATVTADPLFAPALYDLYVHYYKKDINKAWEYFTKYMAVADVEPSDDYQMADMLYLTKRYPQAIVKAKELLRKTGAPNRLNKLLAYIYKETGAPDTAALYMKNYFANGADTHFLAKDYEFMITVFEAMKGYQDSVAEYYRRSIPLQHDDAGKRKIYRKLAAHYKLQKDYQGQAFWLGRYYEENPDATNLDLFNWGISLFHARDFSGSDSVFRSYSDKYPDHVFGYYWQARSNAAVDTTMQLGLAIPHYKKVVEVAARDTANETNKRYLVEAYGYLAAYTVNEEKNYAGAIAYFERLLEIDPAHNDAKKYLEILRKSLNTDSGTQ